VLPMNRVTTIVLALSLQGCVALDDATGQAIDRLDTALEDGPDPWCDALRLAVESCPLADAASGERNSGIIAGCTDVAMAAFNVTDGRSDLGFAIASCYDLVAPDDGQRCREAFEECQ
jgi:hypothetical protein